MKKCKPLYNTNKTCIICEETKVKKVIKKMITFWSPGIIIGNSFTDEIESFNPLKVKWPDNAYAFRFSKREDVICGKNRYEGKTEDVGPLYYHPDSKVETLDEVIKNPNASKILISNMKNNNWEKIVWTRWGNWPQPYDEKKNKVLPKF